jgi:uncharacterized membrane protein YesL
LDSLFSPDSVLMRALTRVADVMILNLLFVVTAIPVVTLGAALTALNFTAMRIATGECNSVSGDYFRSFRRNFRQATVIWLVLAGLAGVLGAWYVVVINLAVGGLAAFVLLAIWYWLAFSFAAMVTFVFPYLARFEGSTREVLGNARRLSMRHPLTTVGAMGLVGLAGVVTVFYPQATGFGLLWLLGGFGGIAVVNGLLLARIFDRYIAAQAAKQA